MRIARVINTARAPLCRRVLSRHRSSSSSSVLPPESLTPLKEQQRILHSIEEDLRIMDQKIATFVLQKDVKAMEDKWQVSSRRFGEELAPHEAFSLLQKRLHVLHRQAQLKMHELETLGDTTDTEAVIKPAVQPPTSHMPAILGTAACACAASAAWYFFARPKHTQVDLVTKSVDKSTSVSKIAVGTDLVGVAASAGTAPEAVGTDSSNADAGQSSQSSDVRHASESGTSAISQSTANPCLGGAAMAAKDESAQWRAVLYGVVGIAALGGILVGITWFYSVRRGPRFPDIDGMQPEAAPSGIQAPTPVVAEASAVEVVAATKQASGSASAPKPVFFDISETPQPSASPRTSVASMASEVSAVSLSPIYAAKSEGAASAASTPSSRIYAAKSDGAASAGSFDVSRQAAEVVFENTPEESQTIDMSASVRGILGGVEHRINQFQSS